MKSATVEIKFASAMYPNTHELDFSSKWYNAT